MKHFSRFRFDEIDRKLWSGADLVPLTRKAAEILACLITHPGATVSHQMLMQSVWPDTHVQQDNIKVLVHELRHALGDSPASPRFIESESGRGYAFIAALADAPCPLLDEVGHHHAPLIVRDDLMGTIEQSLDRAITSREVSFLFLEGISGSGKTTLCREITRRAGRWPALRTSSVRARSRTGGDQFALIVELLERLTARYPALVHPVLTRFAPTWSSRIDDRSHGGGRSDRLEATPGLVRELADALGELCQEHPFLIVLEDLHFAGSRTLDLLYSLAADNMPARLVVVGTYAPFGSASARLALEPFSRLARLQGHPPTLRLLPLTEVQVRDYLERRFGAPCAEALAPPIHRATTGHAASVARVADGLASAGFMQQGIGGWRLTMPLSTVDSLIADTMSDAIRAQLEGINPEDRRLLKAAATVGWRFSDRAIAEVLGLRRVDLLQDSLDTLAAHLPVFERLSPARPKRSTTTAVFRFRHQQWFDLLRERETMALT